METLVCNIDGCTKTPKTPVALKKHRQREHPGYSAAYFEKKADKQQFQCKFCKKGFTTRANRDTHIRENKCTMAPSKEERATLKAQEHQAKQDAKKVVKEKEEKKERKPRTEKSVPANDVAVEELAVQIPMSMEEQFKELRNARFKNPNLTVHSQEHLLNAQYLQQEQKKEQRDDDADLWCSRAESERLKNQELFADKIKFQMPELGSEVQVPTKSLKGVAFIRPNAKGKVKRIVESKQSVDETEEVLIQEDKPSSIEKNEEVKMEGIIYKHTTEALHTDMVLQQIAQADDVIIPPNLPIIPNEEPNEEVEMEDIQQVSQSDKSIPMKDEPKEEHKNDLVSQTIAIEDDIANSSIIDTNQGNISTTPSPYVVMKEVLSGLIDELRSQFAPNEKNEKLDALMQQFDKFNQMATELNMSALNTTYGGSTQYMSQNSFNLQTPFKLSQSNRPTFYDNITDISSLLTSSKKLFPEIIPMTIGNDKGMINTTLLDWQKIKKYKPVTLQQVIGGLRIFTESDNIKNGATQNFKYFFKGGAPSMPVLAQLLTKKSFCKILMIPQMSYDDISQQEFRECFLTAKAVKKNDIERRWICLYKTKAEAEATLLNTKANAHPVHDGICFGVFDENDHIWKIKKRRWTRITKRMVNPIMPPTAIGPSDKRGDIDWWRQGDMDTLGKLINSVDPIKDPVLSTTQQFTHKQFEHEFIQLGGNITSLHQELKHRLESQFEANMTIQEDIPPEIRRSTRVTKTLNIHKWLRHQVQQKLAAMDIEKLNSRHQKRETLDASKFDDGSRRLVQTVLLENHAANSYLIQTRLLISHAIKGQFTGRLSKSKSQQAFTFAGCKAIRAGFVLLTEQWKYVLKEWKRKMLTSLIYDILPETAIYQHFFLTGFDESIPPEELQFTYDVSRLIGSSNGWENIQLEAQECFAKTTVKILKAESNVPFRIATKASAYYLKLSKLWNIVQNGCRVMEDFASYVKPGSVSNKINLSALKSNPMTAQCFTHCGFSLFIAVKDFIEESIFTRKMLAEANRNIRKTPRNDLRTQMNKKELLLQNNSIKPLERCQDMLAIMSDSMRNVSTLLQVSNISLRQCKVQDLAVYSHDYEIRTRISALSSQAKFLKNINIQQILGMQERQLNLELQLNRDIFIIYQKGTDNNGSFIQDVVYCPEICSLFIENKLLHMRQEKLQVDGVYANSEAPKDQNSTVGTNGTNLPHPISPTKKAHKPDGGDSGDSSSSGQSSSDSSSSESDQDSDVEMIDTNLIILERCEHCNKESPDVSERGIPWIILADNHKQREMYVNIQDENLHIQMKVCTVCLQYLSDEKYKYQAKMNELKQKLAMPPPVPPKRSSEIPRNFAQLFSKVGNQVKNEKALRELVCSKWAQLQYANTEHEWIYRLWKCIHELDKIDIHTMRRRLLDKLFNQAVSNANRSERRITTPTYSVSRLPEFKALARQVYPDLTAECVLAERMERERREGLQALGIGVQYCGPNKHATKSEIEVSQQRCDDLIEFYNNPVHGWNGCLQDCRDQLRDQCYIDYYKDTLDTSILNKFSPSQVIDKNFITQKERCEVCCENKATRRFEICLEVIPLQAVPKRFKTTDFQSLEGLYEPMNVCLMCEQDNIQEVRVQKRHRIRTGYCQARSKRWAIERKAINWQYWVIEKQKARLYRYESTLPKKRAELSQGSSSDEEDKKSEKPKGMQKFRELLKKAMPKPENDILKQDPVPMPQIPDQPMVDVKEQQSPFAWLHKLPLKKEEVEQLENLKQFSSKVVYKPPCSTVKDNLIEDTHAVEQVAVEDMQPTNEPEQKMQWYKEEEVAAILNKWEDQSQAEDPDYTEQANIVKSAMIEETIPLATQPECIDQNQPENVPLSVWSQRFNDVLGEPDLDNDEDSYERKRLDIQFEMINSLRTPSQQEATKQIKAVLKKNVPYSKRLQSPKLSKRAIVSMKTIPEISIKTQEKTIEQIPEQKEGATQQEITIEDMIEESFMPAHQPTKTSMKVDDLFTQSDISQSVIQVKTPAKANLGRNRVSSQQSKQPSQKNRGEKKETKKQKAQREAALKGNANIHKFFGYSQSQQSNNPTPQASHVVQTQNNDMLKSQYSQFIQRRWQRREEEERKQMEEEDQGQSKIQPSAINTYMQTIAEMTDDVKQRLQEKDDEWKANRIERENKRQQITINTMLECRDKDISQSSQSKGIVRDQSTLKNQTPAKANPKRTRVTRKVDKHGSSSKKRVKSKTTKSNKKESKKRNQKESKKKASKKEKEIKVENVGCSKTISSFFSQTQKPQQEDLARILCQQEQQEEEVSSNEKQMEVEDEKVVIEIDDDEESDVVDAKEEELIEIEDTDSDESVEYKTQYEQVQQVMEEENVVIQIDDDEEEKVVIEIDSDEEYILKVDNSKKNIDWSDCEDHIMEQENTPNNTNVFDGRVPSEDMHAYTNNEIDRLKPEVFLNGGVIDVYCDMMNLWIRKNFEVPKVYCLSTLFSARIFSRGTIAKPVIPDEGGAKKILDRGIKKSNGIEKINNFDLLLIPICDEIREHWVFAALDLRRKHIVIADPMRHSQGFAERSYCQPLMGFFNTHYPTQFRQMYKFNEPVVAQQDNGYDCGLYVIFYMAALALYPRLEVLSEDPMSKLTELTTTQKRRSMVKTAIRNCEIIDIVSKLTQMQQERDIYKEGEMEQDTRKRQASQMNQDIKQIKQDPSTSKRQRNH